MIGEGLWTQDGELQAARLLGILSRQRYWGEKPIPIIHCPKCGCVPVPGPAAPAPAGVESYQPTTAPASPLAAIDEWCSTTRSLRRSCQAGDQHHAPVVGSSWYFLLRYVDSHSDEELVAGERRTSTCPWTCISEAWSTRCAAPSVLTVLRKFSATSRAIDTDEPFKEAVQQGMITRKDDIKMSSPRAAMVVPGRPGAGRYGCDSCVSEEGCLWDRRAG